MPPTRKTVPVVPSPRKTRSRGEEQQRMDAKEASSEGSGHVEVSEIPLDDTAGISGSPTTNEGMSRRSGRQRTVSKRLQDMELHFGTRRAQIKRENEDGVSEESPKKKAKQGLNSKRNVKESMRKSESDKDDSSPAYTSPICDVLKEKLPPTTSCTVLPQDHQEQVWSESPGHDTQCGGIDHGESGEPSDTPALSESQNKRVLINIVSDRDKVQSVNAKVSETPGNNSIPVPVEQESHKHESLLKCDSDVIQDTLASNEGSHTHAQQREGDIGGSSENTGCLDEEGSKMTTTKESLSVATMKDISQNQQLGDISQNQEAGDISQIQEVGDIVSPACSKPIVIAPINLPKADSSNELPESRSDLTTTQAILASTHAVLASTQAVLDSSHAILTNSGDLGSLTQEAENQKAASTDQDDDDDQSSQPSEPTPQTETVEAPAVEAAAQFVVLDDGRQLLLSDADAMATAADAVASLSQMKDVAFIVSQTGSETAPLVAVASDKQDQADFSQIPVNQRIKFVTVNAQSLANEGESQSTSYPCHLDMVITNQGQVSAGPATILSPDGFYRCSMCAYKTDKKGNWYKHRYTHMAHRKYLCDRCDHKATTSSNLKRHMLIHTDMKVFQCDVCGADFRQKIHLERHMRYRHEKKSVKCKYCDYVCSNVNPDLKVHMKRRHVLQSGGDKLRFRCEACGFIAASARDLKQHQKFHRAGPELKLYCEQCSFVTDCESRLRRHLLTHSKERPFWCSICNYRASQKEHVIRHLRTKHQVTSSRVVQTSEGEDRLVSTVIQPDQSEDEAVSSTEGQAQVACVTTPESSSSNGGVWESGNNTRSVIIAFGHKSAAQPAHEQQWKRVTVSVPGKETESEEYVVQSSMEGTVEGVDRLNGECQGAQESDVLCQKEEAQDQDPQTIDTGDPSSDRLQSETSSSSLLETRMGEADLVNDQQKKLLDRTMPSESGPSEVGISPRTGRESMIIYAPTRKASTKKKYEPADFSSREKVFSCIHCTMKFAKLINLYKHLSVQHKDVQATKDEGLHTCVWCEYQTNKWKNLLVHMRKHNYREEYGAVPTRYACVVCTYSSQQRKALYAHMMKKHKIQIFVKPDGSASCVIDDTVPGTMSSTDGRLVMLQRPRAEVGNEDSGQTPTHTVGQQQQNTSGAAGSFTTEDTQEVQRQSSQSQQSSQPNTQMVMIELEPGMPATAVEIMAPNRSEDVDHEAADAIEGLQALAEQVMAAQQEEEAQVEEGAEEGDFEKGEEQGEGRTDGQQEGEERVAGEGGSEEDQTQIHIQDLSGQVVEGSNIQLTPEQLMQLTSGDYIEINGEMYKVEVAEEGYVP